MVDPLNLSQSERRSRFERSHASLGRGKRPRENKTRQDPQNITEREKLTDSLITANF
jgi:hypothetical protein